MHASRQLPVPKDLLGWVEGVELASYGVGAHSRPLVRMPDAATTLVWRPIADGSSSLLVEGPRTRAAYYDGKDVPVYARFQFAPGAPRALLGIPIDELTDRVVPLRELWGPRGVQLADQITGLDSQPMTTVNHVEAALSARACAVRPQHSTGGNLVRRASIELSTTKGHPSPQISEVVRRLGVSERHLRKAFTTTVGIPPKQYAQLTRIRMILSRLRRDPLARLAHDGGYYDQSHMTAHFREVMHVTPTAFTAGHLPTVPC